MLTEHTANEITAKVITAAIEVHRYLGAGLLESVYQKCLVHELQRSGVKVETRVRVPVRYKDLSLECAYWIDLLVENQVIVELKAVEQLGWIHEAQLLTYLRLIGREVGLVINFNVPLLKYGIRRVMNTK